MESELPWGGEVNIRFASEEAREFTMWCRTPSWASGLSISVNGEDQEIDLPSIETDFMTASGYDPRDSCYLPIKRIWNPGDLLKLKFEMALNMRATHHKVRATMGQVALSYGPLVYCLESVDNPGINIFMTLLDPGSLYTEFDDDLFDGTTIIRGHTTEKEPLTFIPYYLWANRGESAMTVYVGI